MEILNIEGFTHLVGEPLDWNKDSPNTCAALPVREVGTDQGPFFISEWKPTPHELAMLNSGETIKLWIRGMRLSAEDLTLVHPVVGLTVGQLEFEDAPAVPVPHVSVNE